MNLRQAYIESEKLQEQESILRAIVDKYEAITIFDIGACEGESSVRYSRLFPNASVYTFEPIPSNYKLVTENIERYKSENIFPYQLCLSDHEGTATFYVSSGKPSESADENWDYGNKSSSLLPPAKTKEIHPWLKFSESITVQATTLREFCASQNINEIDFIHMDVQGAELMVLNGAGTFIRNIKMIWLEVESVELYKDQPLKKDIEAFMQASGFIKLEDTVYTHAGDQFWANKEYILQKKGSDFIFRRKLFTAVKYIYKKIRRSL